MRQWVLYILLYPSLCICQTVEQKYGDRIELLGVAFKDPLVLCQILIAVFLIVVFLQSSVDKIFERNSNLAFFQSHFSETILRHYTSYLLTIVTIFELIGALALTYGVYYAFAAKTTLWIFYGFVILAITIIFLLIGQRIAKDYTAAAQLVPYFILIMLGIMSMY